MNNFKIKWTLTLVQINRVKLFQWIRKYQRKKRKTWEKNKKCRSKRFVLLVQLPVTQTLHEWNHIWVYLIKRTETFTGDPIHPCVLLRATPKTAVLNVYHHQRWNWDVFLFSRSRRKWTPSEAGIPFHNVLLCTIPPNFALRLLQTVGLPLAHFLIIMSLSNNGSPRQHVRKSRPLTRRHFQHMNKIIWGKVNTDGGGRGGSAFPLWLPIVTSTSGPG